jgi:methionyl-tRNA formyltransferase
MHIFLAGKGPAAEAILAWLVAHKFKVSVFTHEGESMVDAAYRLDCWCTTKSVNDLNAWPSRPIAIVSVGYLVIFKPATIAIMGGRIINGHAALLPYHKGRSSVPWAILNGDRMTGVTYHWVVDGIDAGKILLQGVCSVDYDETALSLFTKINRLLVDFFPAALRLCLIDLAGVEQEQGGEYHYAGPPHGGMIDPRWDDEYTERFIRAMTYPPKPYAKYSGNEVRSMDEYIQLRKQEYVTRDWLL